jgi:microcystin degradation protein MlrC
MPHERKVKSRMRFVTGHISHETNVFSPIRTTYEEFKKRGIQHGEEIFKVYAGTRTPIGGFIDVANRESVELVPTIAAGATPSAEVARDAFDLFLGELLDGIKKAGKIDGVLLALHGAMVVEGIPDGEGCILRAVRGLVGPRVPVVSSLDFHANITREMVTCADALHVYDTYPHVDTYECGMEAARTIIRMARGELKPAMGYRQLPLAPGLTFQYTGSIPMSTVMEYAHRLESQNERVVDISVAAGFPWSDFEDALFSVVTVTDNDQTLAQSLADQVGELSWNMRKLFPRRLLQPREAVKQAMQSAAHPVVLADVADNPGAGGSGDGVEIVRALVELGAKRAAVATVADPEALARCIEAGIGAGLTLDIGAKTDSFHGRSVTVTGKVRLISDGYYLRKGPMSTGMLDKMGKTVVFDTGGVEILLTEQRVQPTDAEVFRSVGIEPTDRQILVVKSCAHFRAAFEPLAKGGVIEVDAPGLSHPDVRRFPFKRIRRPVYPLDEI